MPELEDDGQVDRGVALDLVLRREEKDLGPGPGIEEVAGDDESVSPVVALPGHDDDTFILGLREPGP